MTAAPSRCVWKASSITLPASYPATFTPIRIIKTLFVSLPPSFSLARGLSFPFPRPLFLSPLKRPHFVCCLPCRCRYCTLLTQHTVPAPAPAPASAIFSALQRRHLTQEFSPLRYPYPRAPPLLSIFLLHLSVHPRGCSQRCAATFPSLPLPPGLAPVPASPLHSDVTPFLCFSPYRYPRTTLLLI